MNTREKLALSERPGKVSLIREGMFLRCYEQSLCIFMKEFWPDLRISSRRFINLDGRLVVYGGFPLSRLEKLIPEAKETPWGFEYNREAISDEDYASWFRQVTIASAEVKKKGEKTKANSEKGKAVVLKEEHCYFLKLWQPGKFPGSVDDGFILVTCPQD